jgi:hypothetical protein
MVPGRGDRKPQLAFCVGETSGQMWRPDTAIFTPANRQRFYFRFTVHCENSLDGAFDSETGDAQERLLSSGNNGGVKNIVPILQLSTLSSCVEQDHFRCGYGISRRGRPLASAKRQHAWNCTPLWVNPINWRKQTSCFDRC